MTPLGRLDPVVFRVAVRGGGATVGTGGGLARLLGEGVGGGGGLLLLLGEDPRRLLGGGDGGLLVPSRLCPSCDSPGVRLAAVAPTSSRAATSCRASN
ncbi:hypothetical protein SVIOM342S_09393 [Streptomyces violaceorubidus]